MFWVILSASQIFPSIDLPALYRILSQANKIALFWESLPPATCMPDHCFCEPVQFGVIRQPINTLTNFAFIIAAGLVALYAISDGLLQKKRPNSNPMRSHWVYPALYVSSALAVGIGSMVYHSTMSFWGQSLDILGLYLMSIFMALYNIVRLKGMPLKNFLVGFFCTIAGFWTIATLNPEYRRPLFVVILIAILGSDILVRLSKNKRANGSFYGAAITSLLVGCLAWIGDILGIGCMPQSWFQLHSLWHIGMAGAMFFYYLYYRSETTLAETALFHGFRSREESTC